MADLVTDASGATISSMIGIYYRKVFLERLEANLVYDKFGEQEPIPMNSGNTILWHQLVNPGLGYDLPDGAIPSSSAMSARKVSALLFYKADLRAISDQVDMTAVCPVVTETVAAMGYGAALTKDYFIASQIGFSASPSTTLNGSPSAMLPSIWTQGFPVIEGNSGVVIWPTGGAVRVLNGYFSTKPAISHIRAAVTHLKRMNAMPFEDGNYRAIVHPVVSDAIRSDSTYPTWNAFGNRASSLDKGRLGVIERVYFEESSQAMKTDFPASDWSALYVRAGGSVLGTLIHGKGAYGVSKLGGKDAKVTVVSGEDKYDPLNQLTKIGYKFQMGAVVLNPSCGVILPYFTSGVTY